MKTNVRRGFTLIELVIVIAVIAILAALLVPTILGQAERARVSRAKGDVTELAKALARMRADTASSSAACYTTLTNLNSAAAPAACDTTLPTCGPTVNGLVCWGGPYLSADLNLGAKNDPWSTPYVVTYNQTTASITVTSYGPDKTAGTAGNPGDDIIVTQ